MTRLYATETGKQIALSGLLPETAHYLLDYVARSHSLLSSMLPKEGKGAGDLDQFNYCLMNAALTSTEFEGSNRTRIVPYGFDETTANESVVKYSASLAEAPWEAHRRAANAATLLMNWLEGVDISALEDTYPDLRAGPIQALCRDLAWCLAGLANILASATRPNLSANERPACMRQMPPQALQALHRLPAFIRLLIRRLLAGLPTPALWLLELEPAPGGRAVSRNEAISLHQINLSSMENLRRRANWEELIRILAATGASDAKARAHEIQTMAHAWHGKRRERALKRQLQRLEEADQPLLKEFYDSREKKFEAAFEALMKRVGIPCTLFDSGQKPGAFDYLLRIEGRPPVIVECKTKQGDHLVDLNAARTVLSSSEQYGHQGTFCVTLCQPGVDPNVLESLQACTRLSIAETHDFAEAMTRLMTNSLTAQSFHDWLTQPGQVTSEMLLAYTNSATEPSD
ncbi:hypothetical protein [Stigmatella aurantiaca]|uniref:Restriction endonuclease n=1 Tax=Stigmatella aurantiaca (strain DW4/3-1) TaxID=378806 RepID=Q093I6_STIAD|nr:hypothetical protein [Stigmatella aurantiaca]ADO75969.1 uncharacterized protein STAUR_8214 [Stigmatella aurantiaca DW4/3-1]EAU66894.1 hypothetical protein STIAU_3189 [Stigmatella aurantiaca DW4/3-1]